MKNLAIIIFCFTSIFSQAQINEFAPVGAKWYYTESYAFSGDIDYLYIESVKDTVIKGKTCNVLKNNGGLACAYYSEEDYVYTEDSVVYFYVSQIDSFQVLYNLKAKKGDSWKVVFQVNVVDKLDTILVQVDSVCKVVINGKNLIKQFITQKSLNDGWENYSTGSIIVEQIGDLNYLFNFYSMSGIVCDGNISNGLRCYEDSILGYYSTGIADSCTYTYKWIAPYVPLPEANAMWREYGSCSDYQYLIAGDTILNGKIYKKVYKSGVNYATNEGVCSNNIIESFDNFFGVFRNDVLNKKVYTWNFQINKEELLYDFDLNIGDTLHSSFLNRDSANQIKFVKSIDFIEIYGKIRNVYGISTSENHNYTYLIDGIGSTLGLFSSLSYPNENNLLCFKLNGFTVYPYFYENCDIINGKEEITNNNSIEISPNPFQKSIFVNINDVKVLRIEILNLTGFKVFEKNTLRFKNEIELDLSSLKSGVYFAKITTLDNKILVKKILKM